MTARWLGFACWLAIAAPLTADDLKLHVPSPDWRGQVLYFVLIDRFADGDPRNNRQSKNDFDPTDRRKYSGGDLAGLTRRLDYIEGLGATGLWITPPVAHQWWDGQVGYGGYHGYWGEHFKQVDKHFGSLDDYKHLSDALHRREMVLVQDIVLNHTGNYFRVPPGFDPAVSTDGFSRNTQSEPPGPPRQSGLALNDARRAKDRRAAIYHWTPAIRDFNVAEQEQTWALADLDDLNTRNPAVRELLRDSYGYWIKEVGVDGFRIDTVFYVEPELFPDFLRSTMKRAPGIERVAKQTGRENFLSFGEGFGIDPPYQQVQAEKIERYRRAPDGSPRLPGMINFTLYGSLHDVLIRGRPAAVLSDRIERMQRVHGDLGLMPTFIDNHDVDRFLKSGSEPALKQALFAILTLPGIPVIYYGTEQGFREPRQAMFAGGFQSGGKDAFDVEAPLYRFLQRAIALRRSNIALTHGVPQPLAGNAARSGVVLWRMNHAKQTLLVALNTAVAPARADAISSGLKPGTRLEPLYAIDGASEALSVDAAGELALALPPSSGVVWKVVEADALARFTATIALDALASTVSAEAITVSGRVAPTQTLALTLDGQSLGTIEPDADGAFSTAVDVSELSDPEVAHRLVVRSAGARSATHAFRVVRQWQTVAEVDDPLNDDHGPTGAYRYPTDPTWGPNRQMDLRGATLERAGKAWRLSVSMRTLSALWNAPNGFDHVALTVYVEVPGRAGGARVLPLQNASLPDDRRWHFRLRAGGWAQAWTGAEGASATSEGTTEPNAPSVRAITAEKRLEIVLPAAALNGATDKLRVYVTTWDYDAGYRALSPEGGGHSIGGAPSEAPKIMDALWIESP
jgi:glycosidase